MAGYIGSSDARREITEIAVGTSNGVRPVEKAYVGTTGGNALWFLRPGSVTLQATPASSSSINLIWNAPGTTGYVYSLYRGGTLVYSGTGTSFTDSGLAASTKYTYTVDATKNGSIIRTATASATTSAPPPPPPPPPPQPTTQQRVWQAYPVELQSYAFDGTRVRTNWTGTNGGKFAMMYGYVSSNWGNQFSQARWAIPTECRSWGNCVSVDRVELRWWNTHHYLASGGRVSMVGHHNTSLASYGGSTGALLDGGNQVRWPAPRGSWINGTEWYDLAWLTSANRPSIAEEIRVNGLQGFGLVPAYSGTSGYGYASTDPILRITYTVRVG